MFKIYAVDRDPKQDHVTERVIGWIVSRSETTTSLWGDQKLFFQHQKMDDDIFRRNYYSPWLPTWSLGEFSFDKLDKQDLPEVKCPFYFLFE
mmetsp:Transcript_15716/g.21259  ORF Transcript_15716/g.21259 Transcript_15716/m.21259 type:complete len:92 (+) Transcript_15716:366-641(+)